MTYVYIHYHHTKPLHLHPGEILPWRIKVSAYKPFPGICDTDFTPAFLYLFDTPEKKNPLHNCPVQAITEVGFFSSILH